VGKNSQLIPLLIANNSFQKYMHQYLRDTEFAVSNLIQLAHKEEAQLWTLSIELKALESQLKIFKWDFESSDMNDDFSDVYVMSAFNRMAKSHIDVEALKHQVALVQASIGARQQATQAISGAIFQVAKQGISLVHGGLDAAPNGRLIKSVPVKTIVWQARNQAMHFEEGTPKQPVKDLFAILEAEQGPQFSLSAHGAQSRAKQVLDLLGWNEYPAYLSDMSLILSP
jgi:hypothetical protein